MKFIPILIFLLALTSSLLAALPEVAKVEPPDWWVAHTLNPVRLLITGKKLSGAKVETGDAGLRADNARASDNGDYLFFDLHVASSVAPGKRSIKITTSEGSAQVDFELRFPLSREGRFQGFSPDDIIYLIMPDRFANGDPSNDDPEISRGLHDRTRPRFYHGGDLQGIINRLPYLKDLGVTALWLNPWYDNVNHLNYREKYTHDNRLSPQGEPITDYHGYGAVDFYAVEERFGDLNKLRELVEAAHRHDIKIIQDQVANHTGPYHRWATNPPTPTWFNGTPQFHLANTWQTWTIPDPHASDALRKATLEGWFIDLLPDLNQNDPDCARYLIQNALWWVGVTGLDAIRQDTLPYVPRTFWRDWSDALHREFPKLVILGEMYDEDVAKVSFFQGGRKRFDGVDSGIDTLFDFPLYYPVRRVFAQNQSMRNLAQKLAADHLYEDPTSLVTFLGLHDVNRFMNEQGANISGLKLAFTFLLTTRGVPLIYYGDEIAMEGGGDPHNRKPFPGGWLDDARDAFSAAGRTAEEQSVFEHVRKLARLRRELEPMRRGKLINLLVEDQNYAYARKGNTSSASVLVAMNNTPRATSIEVDVTPLGWTEGARITNRLHEGPDIKVEQGRVRIPFTGREAGIWTPVVERPTK